MTEFVPPSLEIMTEEFYDALAWLRDLHLPPWPSRADAVSLTVYFPTVAKVWYPDEDELGEVEALLEMELRRYPDGTLHVHGPGVCADIDLSAFKEKRP